MVNKKCGNCGHSIYQHDFSHSGECRATKDCGCEKFIDLEEEKQFVQELNEKREKEVIE